MECDLSMHLAGLHAPSKHVTPTWLHVIIPWNQCSSLTYLACTKLDINIKLDPSSHPDLCPKIHSLSWSSKQHIFPYSKAVNRDLMVS
jgi:hypothetical protein